MGKVILWNGCLKRFEFGNAKMYRMYVAAVALAKRRAKFTIVTVVAVKIDYRNGLGIGGDITNIATRHHIERQEVNR